jgi:hypothetical protein
MRNYGTGEAIPDATDMRAATISLLHDASDILHAATITPHEGGDVWDAHDAVLLLPLVATAK